MTTYKLNEQGKEYFEALYIEFSSWTGYYGLCKFYKEKSFFKRCLTEDEIDHLTEMTQEIKEYQ